MKPQYSRQDSRVRLHCPRTTVFAAAVSLLLCAAPLAALPVPEAMARIVARNAIRQHIALFGSWGGVRAVQIDTVEPVDVGTDRLAYNVRVRPTGHVLVAADDEFSPVLLYSDTSAFDVSNVEVAEAFESWLVTETANVRRQLQELARGRLPGSRPDGWEQSRPGRAWVRFGVPDQAFVPLGRRLRGASSSQAAGDWPAESVTVGEASGVVEPLLPTNWAQGNPYNTYTPAAAGCSNTVAGCVAISVAQLMRYWSWPETGTGSHSYSWNGQTLFADFDHPYDWANMAGQLGGSSTVAQIDAVARLISDVGVAVNMNYGCSGSSASTSYAATSVLPTYFSYKPTSGQVSRSNTTALEFFARIEQELDASPARPMLFTVYTTAGGHSLVIDGYQTATTDQVHLNLGWGASYQGWYDITNNWSAGGYVWNASTQAIYPGIEPANAPSPVPATSGVEPSSISAGSGAFTLTVNGSDFAPSSLVLWNGSARPTTYVGANASAGDDPGR